MATPTVTAGTEARPKALFLSHGGGPGFFLKGGSTGFRSMNADSPCAKWYKTFTQKWSKPSAIVIISAHWEERDAICVTSGAKHPLLYDYYGFPSHTYELDYPCPGHPVLAGHIVDFLRQGGFQARGDKTRGYDHGVFIPLKLMYPEADIPVVQISLLAGLSAESHIKIGMALRGLFQDDGVLVVGSGQATHGYGGPPHPGYPVDKDAPREAAFMAWLTETTTDSAAVSPQERCRRLIQWNREAPQARLAHPREEHLMPLHVVSGLTDFRPGEVIFGGSVAGGMSLACLGYWGPRDAKEEES